MAKSPDNPSKPTKAVKSRPAAARKFRHYQTQGVGWGGPARGEKKTGEEGRRLLTLSYEERLARSADKDQRAKEALVTLEHVMHTSMNDSARVTAADKLLDRLVGRAPQATLEGDAKKTTLEDLVLASIGKAIE